MKEFLNEESSFFFSPIFSFNCKEALKNAVHVSASSAVCKGNRHDVSGWRVAGCASCSNHLVPPSSPITGRRSAARDDTYGSSNGMGPQEKPRQPHGWRSCLLEIILVATRRVDTCVWSSGDMVRYRRIGLPSVTWAKSDVSRCSSKFSLSARFISIVMHTRISNKVKGIIPSSTLLCLIKSSVDACISTSLF
jgi:hypothetical protein